MALEWVLAFLALGSFAGFTAGLFGVGGGAVVMPVLISIFLAQGIAPEHVVHLALGTSMANIVTTSISSMRAHHANGGVVWPVVYRMAPAVLLGAFLATFIAAYLPSLYLAIFFAVFMAYVSLQMILNKKPSPSNKQPSRVEQAGVGLGIGVVSALVSIGGGTMTVPYLTWRNVDIKKAIGTSAAMGLPISLAGAFGYAMQKGIGLPYSIGFVYLPAVLIMSCASFILAPYGARLAHRLPVAKLKKLFALLLITLSLKMLFSVV